jgi:hypothetical protein
VQREGLEVTDDVSIIEALGRPVRITPGSYTNIKARVHTGPAVDLSASSSEHCIVTSSAHTDAMQHSTRTEAKCRA